MLPWSQAGDTVGPGFETGTTRIRGHTTKGGQLYHLAKENWAIPPIDSVFENMLIIHLVSTLVVQNRVKTI